MSACTNCGIREEEHSDPTEDTCGHYLLFRWAGRPQPRWPGDPQFDAAGRLILPEPCTRDHGDGIPVYADGECCLHD